MEPSRTIERYSVDEARAILTHLEGVFREVRLVDPEECHELRIDKSGRIVVVGDCYVKWFVEERCGNCTSAQALRSGEKREKFELLGDTIYWVASKPVAIETPDGVVECVIEGIVSSSVSEYSAKLGANPAVDRALMEERGFYVDWSTKMYNRRYFDEGVFLGYLNLRPSLDVAMVVFKVSNIGDMVEVFGGEDRDFLFRQLALLIERHISTREIVIRMDDDSFLVIMPSASRSNAQRLVDQVRDDAPQILSDERWGEDALVLSAGMSWASPFERTDRHARILYREAEENAYLDRRGILKEWDDSAGEWTFSVEDAVQAASALPDEPAGQGSGQSDSASGEDGFMATASEMADILEGDPDTAADPLAICFREFAKKDRGRPTESFRFPMPLMGTAFELGNADAAVASIDDSTEAALAREELNYLRDFNASVVRNLEPLRERPNDLSVRVAAGLLSTMANISTGHPVFARRAKEATEELCKTGIRTSKEPRTRAACAIVDGTIVTLFAESRESHAPIAEAIAELPEGQRLYASYLIALQAFHLGEYGNSLGVIKTSLTFVPGNYPVPLAYLHTMAACNHMALHQPHEAEREFEEAWRYAAPDGIVAPFIEHYVYLQGLLDSCMKRSDPGLYRAISKAAGRFRAGWVAIVDPASAEIFETSPLTPSEMTIAALASRGWTNREIATQLTLSENTVKHRLSSVFQKLGISRRSELSDFPLT